MANTKKGSWKEERASVKSNSMRPRSNKYRTSESSERPAAGSISSYWRAGYTRRDGTQVKGHYVRKSR